MATSPLNALGIDPEPRGYPEVTHAQGSPNENLDDDPCHGKQQAAAKPKPPESDLAAAIAVAAIPNRPDSPHTAWKVKGFAAYADYMDTPEFQQAAQFLIEQAVERYTAIMCAEARPEQCHRRIIADWLTVRGVEVVHIMTPTRLVLHNLTEFARAEGGCIIYDKQLL